MDGPTHSRPQLVTYITILAIEDDIVIIIPKLLVHLVIILLRLPQFLQEIKQLLSRLHTSPFTHMCFTNCMHPSRLSPPSLPPLPHPTLQVKIWFQNKRSKFKKLLKQGGNPHESDPIPGSMSLSPRSPTIPPIWDVSASSKGVNMPANSYMPGYSHWYSSPHQDSMQR